MRTRRSCPTHVQVDVLIAQDNRCLYCGHRFGDLVVRKGNDWQWLEIEWDHFVPFAYSNANPDDGWVAACHLCNSYKSDLIFPDVLAVRVHILERAVRNQHDPLPFWHTGEAVAAPDATPPAAERTADDEALPEADVTLATEEEASWDDDDQDESDQVWIDSDIETWPAARAARRYREAQERRLRSLRRTTQRPVSVDEWLTQHGERASPGGLRAQLDNDPDQDEDGDGGPAEVQPGMPHPHRA